MSTTNITSGTDFIGKTLIIGSTGTSNTDYARVVEFNNNSTGTYLGVMFSATNKQPWFSFRPLGQMYSEPIMPWISYINVYYIYVFSFISNIQVKYNIYEYNGASTIVSKGTIGTYTGASAFLQNLTQFWLGRNIWTNDFYNGRYNKVALYNGDLFALTEANILSTLLTLVTSTQTNIINNSTTPTTYTFRALGTNFLGVVVNILNYNTTTGSDVSNTAITLIGTGATSGGYLNIIGSYLETAPISSLISLHNFNSANKSWKMYAHTLSSISGDHLTIKPHSGRNIILEVSANNDVFIKQGENSHNLTNLISGSGTGIVSGSDASFANIDISGNLNPLNVNGSSIGVATKNWNSAYINTIYGETLNTYHSDKTLAINSNILTISGELITSGNINPLTSINSSLGLSTKYWGNAYIKDISTTSIEISGNIICSRDVSINLGSSLRRWKHVFSDDLSVNKINGQVYSGSSSIVLSSISGNIIPSLTNLFRLGDVSRNWSNAYIIDASVSSIDVSLNINPLFNNGSSLGLNARRWGNAYIRDVSVSSIDVSGNLNPLNANGSSLGLSTKYWGNAYLRDVSVSSIDVSGNLNPLTNNGSSLGLISRTWGNAYIRDLSVSSIDVSSNSISPFVNNSASLGAPNKSWGNAYIRDVSVSSIDVISNLNPLTSNTLTLGLPTRVWGNAYIRDLSISSIDVSSNTISPFLNNGSSLGLISKTWGNAYLRDISVTNIDISQNLNPLVSGTSTVTATQGTGGTVSISGGYIIHSFRTTGTSAFVPASSGSVEVLIVGGGGGGGPTLGGGGGAGGVIYIPSTNVILGTSYEVVVGDGGASGTNGQLSRVFGATAAGGGTSGTHDSGDGTAGGSGGGAASNNSRLNQGGGTSGNILGTNNGVANVGFIYGCSGGHMTTARTSGPCRGAGGGGAGAKGLDTNSNITGDTGQTGMGSGGVGVVNAILGPSYYWGGGGGGSGYDNQFGGWGGLGGGGGGAGNSGGGTGGKSALVDGSNGSIGGDTNGGNGGTNTGGGGGAGAWYSGLGGKGGSGIVVIRYLQGTSGSSGSNLGSSLKRWKNIFVGDLSVNTINGTAYGSGGGGAASIVYTTGGSAIVNSSIVSNMIPSITNTYSLGSTSRYWNNAYINNLRLSNRGYQEISGDISWSAVNGYYGLAKDAYPGLNPLSSGVKAVQTWTGRTVPNTTILCRGVCWSPELGLFVAVAESGPNKVMTSPNGITWTARTAALENRWYSVCWSKELRIFVAVSRDINVMTSVDGITWISRTPASGAGRCVCWSAELGLFVAVSDNNVARSSDGITWFSSVGIPEGAYLGVCWSPQLRLFVAGSAQFTRLISSSNGITWATITGAPIGQWTSICWSPELGLFVAVGFAGVAVITSSDGIVWTERTPSTYGLGWFGVCWSRELEIFVAVSITGTNNTRVMTSPNGITWTTQAAGGTDWWYGVCWSPELGIFASVGTGPTNIVMTSSLKGRPPTSYNLFDSTFNNIDENGKWNFLNIAVSGTMTAGSTPVSSDDRLKHNEVGITNGLTIIDQLNPKFYQKTFSMLDASYNGDLSGYAWTYEAGLIAQEVLQVPDISFVVSGGDYYEKVMNYYDISYTLSYYEQKMNSDLSFANNYEEQRINNDLSFTISYYKEKMGSDISFDVSNNIEQIISDLSFDMSYIIQKMNNEASFYISYNEQKINYDLSFEVGYYQQQAINDLSRANAYEVTTNLVSQIYGVNYNSLLTYGLAAIKELHAKVKAQDLSLLEQQATINSLAARLQALEPNTI